MHPHPIHRAVYPGSFDPVTNGHVDVIERATRIFDELIVGVAVSTPKETLFSIEERVALLKEVCAPFPNASVEVFDKLLVDWAIRRGALTIVRGLRALSDFDYEFQMALANRKLEPRIETVFLMASEECACISSTMIKQIAALGGEVTRLVPPCVAHALRRRLAS
ncbi:MAG: pantetheine-phosphate adenylyltransferase [bacterium]|nr:pantetheine-phosphate adenylyltransferase [bacterium]